MSGLPINKQSDATKFRQEYLDSLNLQVQLNNANEEAVRNFVATGQVPPISQMKDMRTTTQILADAEKLKINLIKDLEPIADPQFAQTIINRLISSPLNVDNRLLVFTAQRIPEIVKNLQKLYKYGIKGDENDAINFVSFINKFYTDKNKITESVKSYFNRLGEGKDTGSVATQTQYKSYLSSIADWNAIFRKFQVLINKIDYTPYRKIHNDINKISTIIDKKFDGIIDILPKDSSKITNLEQQVIRFSGDKRYEPVIERIDLYLNFINRNLPSIQLINSALNNLYNSLPQFENLIKQNYDGDYSTVLKNIYDNILSLDGTIDIDIDEIKKLKQINQDLTGLAGEFDKADFKTDLKAAFYLDKNEVKEPENQDALRESKDDTREDGNTVRSKRFNIKDKLDKLDELLKTVTISGDNEKELIYIKRNFNRLETENNPKLLIELNRRIDRLYRLLEEIKRRNESSATTGASEGLPTKARRDIKGKGLPIDYSKGIEASPRYVKFGRYVINNKKLNDNVLSLRRPKGSSISTIPANKMSSNLGKIVKQIVGGGIPSYDDLNKLTDDEKRYLYKVSQEADIYDKIKIPTPSKDQEEKDIHQFNVMKGEILAGNNSKELISKFKALLLKLTKQNILPKSQVNEILEELLELGI